MIKEHKIETATLLYLSFMCLCACTTPIAA